MTGIVGSRIEPLPINEMSHMICVSNSLSWPNSISSRWRLLRYQTQAGGAGKLLGTCWLSCGRLWSFLGWESVKSCRLPCQDRAGLCWKNILALESCLDLVSCLDECLLLIFVLGLLLSLMCTKTFWYCSVCFFSSPSSSSVELPVTKLKFKTELNLETNQTIEP